VTLALSVAIEILRRAKPIEWFPSHCFQYTAAVVAKDTSLRRIAGFKSFVMRLKEVIEVARLRCDCMSGDLLARIGPYTRLAAHVTIRRFKGFEQRLPYAI